LKKSVGVPTPTNFFNVMVARQAGPLAGTLPTSTARLGLRCAAPPIGRRVAGGRMPDRGATATAPPAPALRLLRCLTAPFHPDSHA